MFTTIVALVLGPFLVAMAAHFIGDFPFQADWMAANKGKSWEILAYHCLVYTATFALASCLTKGITVNPWAYLVLLITHVIIDALKARYNVVKKIWQDQLLHAIVLAALVAAGWIS